MPDNRGALIAWSAGVSAVAVTFVGILASRATTPLSQNPWFIACLVVACLSFAILLLGGLAVLVSGWRSRERRPVAVAAQPNPPAAAITGRWRLATNAVGSEMLQLQNNGMNHPGYTRRTPQDNPPPSFRIGMSVACSPLDPTTPTTTEVRARFLSFLGQPPVIDLVRELTALGDGLAWRARDDNPRHNFAAVLSLPNTQEAPLAWARVLLPEEMTRRHGRDFRSAYLVLYVEPRSADGSPAPAASLVSWHQRLSQALKLPAALAEFLVGQLGLPTSADPAAEVGVWLKTPQALTELVDVDGYASVEGSAQSNWFMGFAMADPDGQRLSDLAEAWLRQLCDSALHLDGYEADLASLRSGTSPGQRLAVKVVQQDSSDQVPSAAAAPAYLPGLQPPDTARLTSQKFPLAQPARTQPPPHPVATPSGPQAADEKPAGKATVRSDRNVFSDAVNEGPEPVRGDPGRAARLLADAERAAKSITNEPSKAQALASIVAALAATDPDRAARLLADAERVAQSITRRESKAWALASIAKALAATDPDRARLLADAEHAAQSIDQKFSKILALIDVAKTMAATDPDRARLLADAERVRQSIDQEFPKRVALTSIAKAMAATDPDRRPAPRRRRTRRPVDHRRGPEGTRTDRRRGGAGSHRP